MSVMPIDTAMVLAAGLGTRMRPLTDFTPKPLIEVVGKALIDYTLDRFEAAGVKRTIVNVHYLADQIESHVADRVVPEIIVSDERAMLLETGGGLKKALPLLGTAPVFCSNTDAILVDGDGDEACARLSSTWDPERMDALLLLSPIKETSGYNGTGDADLDADGRVSFRKGERADYVFTGLQIIKAAAAAGGPEGGFSTKLLWDQFANHGRLFGVVHDGFWLHVGDVDGLAAAELHLSEVR